MNPLRPIAKGYVRAREAVKSRWKKTSLAKQREQRKREEYQGKTGYSTPEELREALLPDASLRVQEYYQEQLAENIAYLRAMQRMPITRRNPHFVFIQAAVQLALQLKRIHRNDATYYATMRKYRSLLHRLENSFGRLKITKLLQLPEKIQVNAIRRVAAEIALRQLGKDELLARDDLLVEDLNRGHDYIGRDTPAQKKKGMMRQLTAYFKKDTMFFLNCWYENWAALAKLNDHDFFKGMP